MKRQREEDEPPNTPSSKQQRADTLRLNVGGRLFQMTRQTLEGIPFFAPLVDGRMPFAVDEKGCAFVDRSGKRRFIMLL